MPRVKVTFQIDANGTMTVHAKAKAIPKNTKSKRDKIDEILMTMKDLKMKAQQGDAPQKEGKGAKTSKRSLRTAAEDQGPEGAAGGDHANSEDPNSRGTSRPRRRWECSAVKEIAAGYEGDSA